MSEIVFHESVCGFAQHFSPAGGTFVKSADAGFWTNLNMDMVPRGWTIQNPDGTVINSEPVPGVFTVDMTGKKVKFAPGNLYWDGAHEEWAFEAHQYDYTTEWDPDHVDRLHWSSDARVARAEDYENANTEYGITPAMTDSFFAADGGAIEGWTVLTRDEWYFVTRNAQQKKGNYEYGDPEYETQYKYVIDGINCAILLPDGYTRDILKDSYTAEEWAAAEAEYGLVALPFAGLRDGSSVDNVGSYGYYWSCTPDEDSAVNAYDRCFYPEGSCWYSHYRDFGRSVRLVSVQ